jgi:hypothetical protein
MAIGGIGSGGGAGSALLTLRLALRQSAPAGGAAGAASAAAPAAPTTPDAMMQEAVARAQFSASLKVAGAAVEQVDVMLRTYDAAAGAPAA